MVGKQVKRGLVTVVGVLVGACNTAPKCDAPGTLYAESVRQCLLPCGSTSSSGVCLGPDGAVLESGVNDAATDTADPGTDAGADSGADSAMDVREHDASVDATREAATDATDGAATDSGVSMLRAIAPLSSSTVTSSRPTLKWSSPAASSATRVELCRDRAMSAACQMQTVTGSSTRPTASLAMGRWYWRVRSVVAGTPATTASPVWQFSVGARSTMVDSSWDNDIDFNGDGYADVVVGAPYAAPGTVYSRLGVVNVFYGSAAGTRTTPGFEIVGTEIREQLGRSVASARDINGDGFADLVVGAIRENSRVFHHLGRVSVFYGSAMGLPRTASLVIEGEPVMSLGVALGWTVEGAGDVNGDGFADVLAGEGFGGEGFGGSRLYLGGLTGLATTPATVLSSGVGVAGAGDLNGDGFADMLVARRTSFGVGSGPGNARAYLGSATGLSATPAWEIAGTVQNERVGSSVASGGDLNGDGFADVVVGAPARRGVGDPMGFGTARVFYGSAAGLSTTPSLVITGPLLGDGFGETMASAGDVNGDGFADVVVGAPGVQPSMPGVPFMGVGSIRLYLGSATGLSPTPASVLQGAAGEVFITSISGAGDVNGDGFADVVVGVPDNARVYLGSATGLSATAVVLLSCPNTNGDIVVARVDRLRLGQARRVAPLS
ncbi:MAG: FG-GAP-like repeat-containing protein [Deltaproteobacteria bacterium]|nr:FG-GAP-like repeat-containing protein [Deltaproteobacteria bacterium]